jgi:hypothetical protein
MPHYKNGSSAKEGDVVKGIPYNTKGKEVSGIITNINLGSDICNCMILFLKEMNIGFPEDQLMSGVYYKHFKDRDGVSHFYDICSDYGEVKAFEKIL